MLRFYQRIISDNKQELEGGHAWPIRKRIRVAEATVELLQAIISHDDHKISQESLPGVYQQLLEVS